jgi:hypothetical protein
MVPVYKSSSDIEPQSLTTNPSPFRKYKPKDGPKQVRPQDGEKDVVADCTLTIADFLCSPVLYLLHNIAYFYIYILI